MQNTDIFDLAYWLAACPAGIPTCLDLTVALIPAVVCQIPAGRDARSDDFSRRYASNGQHRISSPLAMACVSGAITTNARRYGWETLSGTADEATFVPKRCGSR
jgi:hypothetical protein